MIAIIDYGMGNLGSVSKALKSLGAEVKVTHALFDLQKADKIVLPGVGAFKDTMSALSRLGILDGLKDIILSEKPYLGICLGLEILFEESAEGGKNKGLSIFKGDAAKFEAKTLKVPHIGWNQIRRKKSACPLLHGIDDGAFFYFVHSYYVRPEDKNLIASVTDYGGEFASMVWKDNMYAVQFHPEKSQENGIRFLENFIRL